MTATAKPRISPFTQLARPAFIQESEAALAGLVGAERAEVEFPTAAATSSPTVVRVYLNEDGIVEEALGRLARLQRKYDFQVCVVEPYRLSALMKGGPVPPPTEEKPRIWAIGPIPEDAVHSLAAVTGLGPVSSYETTEGNPSLDLEWGATFFAGGYSHKAAGQIKRWKNSDGVECSCATVTWWK